MLRMRDVCNDSVITFDSTDVMGNGVTDKYFVCTVKATRLGCQEGRKSSDGQEVMRREEGKSMAGLN